MKRILVVLIISVIAFSCKETEPKMDAYIINGTATGVYDGVRAYLKIKGDRGRDIIKDTAIVFDEKFTFEGKVDTPEILVLSVNSVQGEMPIVIENTTMTININKENIQESEVSGSKSNEAFTKYSLAMNEMNKERFEINKTFSRSYGNKDSIITKKLNSQIETLNKEVADFPFEFMKKHKDNFFSLILLESQITSQITEKEKIEQIEQALESFDNDLKSSSLGKKISSQIELLKQESERSNSLNIGKTAPNFSAPKADGQLLSLNDVKGKVTIIDFWAAWCGPCRRENPNVVNVYNKYHNKGLEIIGISLDRPGQKDKWLKAIEDDKLTWHHVSNLQYFNDPVAQLYNIKSIPATYILDSNGIIVAKNLRGPALEAKIAELLN
uniref:redoxin domain-containing protein n=1 Tax=Gelidibacter sp. TaxID=2018083 RepID=UPI0040493753